MHNRSSSSHLGELYFKICPSISLWRSIWWTFKILHIAINVKLSRDHLYIMYGNVSGISFWKKVREECKRILKNLSRLNSTLSLAGDTSYWGEQSHHIITFLFLQFLKCSCGWIKPSPPILYLCVKLLVIFFERKLQMSRGGGQLILWDLRLFSLCL